MFTKNKKQEEKRTKSINPYLKKIMDDILNFYEYFKKNFDNKIENQKSMIYHGLLNGGIKVLTDDEIKKDLFIAKIFPGASDLIIAQEIKIALSINGNLPVPPKIINEQILNLIHYSESFVNKNLKQDSLLKLINDDPLLLINQETLDELCSIIHIYAQIIFLIISMDGYIRNWFNKLIENNKNEILIYYANYYDKNLNNLLSTLPPKEFYLLLQYFYILTEFYETELTASGFLAKSMFEIMNSAQINLLKQMINKKIEDYNKMSNITKLSYAMLGYGAGAALINIGESLWNRYR